MQLPFCFYYLNKRWTATWICIKFASCDIEESGFILFIFLDKEAMHEALLANQQSFCRKIEPLGSSISHDQIFFSYLSGHILKKKNWNSCLHSSSGKLFNMHHVTSCSQAITNQCTGKVAFNILSCADCPGASMISHDVNMISHDVSMIEQFPCRLLDLCTCLIQWTDPRIAWRHFEPV